MAVTSIRRAIFAKNILKKGLKILRTALNVIAVVMSMIFDTGATTTAAAPAATKNQFMIKVF